MKKLSLVILFITFITSFTVIAQQSYQPTYPNYSIELTKAGSNSPTGNLFIYGGQTVPVYEVGKLTNTPTYKRAFYQWNINNSQVPSVAIIDSIALEFDAQFVNNQTSTLNYFNCWLDLSDPNLNKNNLWNYSDKTQYTPIGEGQINTPPSNYVTHRHSFFNGSNFVNSFISALQQNNRFTLGIAWKYEDPSAGNIYWRIKPINLKVYFHIPNQSVTLDQRLSNNTQVGKLRKWEGSEIGFTPPPYINPGTPFEFPLLSTQTIQGDQAIYSGEKYNNWNGDKTDVRNHKEFLITAQTNQLISKFEPTKLSITIKNSIESSSTSGGIIHFKDPWLIDYPDPLYGNTLRNRGMDAPFKQRPSPFYPDYTTSYNGDVYKGVFLNQGLDWQPPYYSVKADAVQDIQLQQTGRTHRFYFQNWSASPQGSAEFQDANALETPVVFKQDGATVQANYKGTQLTGTTSGFSNSSQRKLVVTSYPESYYHLVYASGGSVWYEKAQVNYDVVSPVNWQLMNGAKPLNGELNITEAKSPSIDYVYATHNTSEENYYIYIVYQKKKTDGKYEIRLSKFDKNSSKIFDTQVFNSAYANYSTVDCMPVVGVSRQSNDQAPIKIVVLWKRPDEGTSSAGLYYLAGFDQGTSINWTDNYPNPLKIATTDANSTNPSIAAFKSPLGNIYYHLAYQQGTSQIKYVAIAFGVRGTGSSTPTVVSSGSGSNTNISPSITVSSVYGGDNTYDSPKIVWCNLGDDGNGFYRYRSTMQNNWSPFYIYGENDDVQSPTISGPKYHPSGIDDVFHFGWSWLGGYYKSYVVTNNLSQKLSMPFHGKNIQIANNREDWDGFGYCVLDNVSRTSAPFTFENKWITPQLNKSAIANIHSGRAGTVIKNDAEFYFAFGDIKLNDKPIEFEALNDTVTISTSNDLNSYLLTNALM